MSWVMNVPKAFAEETDGRDDIAVISITEPGVSAAIRPGFKDVLRLQFHDVDPLRHIEHVWFTVFNEAQAQEIVAFATKHRGANFLVHCHAGVSRSGAVVETILRAFPEYEDHGWGRLPNGHVKALLVRAFGLTPIGVEL